MLAWWEIAVIKISFMSHNHTTASCARNLQKYFIIMSINGDVIVTCRGTHKNILLKLMWMAQITWNYQNAVVYRQFFLTWCNIFVNYFLWLRVYFFFLMICIAVAKDSLKFNKLNDWSKTNLILINIGAMYVCECNWWFFNDL